MIYKKNKKKQSKISKKKHTNKNNKFKTKKNINISTDNHRKTRKNIKSSIFKTKKNKNTNYSLFGGFILSTILYIPMKILEKTFGAVGKGFVKMMIKLHRAYDFILPRIGTELKNPLKYIEMLLNIIPEYEVNKLLETLKDLNIFNEQFNKETNKYIIIKKNIIDLFKNVRNKQYFGNYISKIDNNFIRDMELDNLDTFFNKPRPKLIQLLIDNKNNNLHTLEENKKEIKELQFDNQQAIKEEFQRFIDSEKFYTLVCEAFVTLLEAIVFDGESELKELFSIFKQYDNNEASILTQLKQFNNTEISNIDSKIDLLGNKVPYGVLNSKIDFGFGEITIIGLLKYINENCVKNKNENAKQIMLFILSMIDIFTHFLKIPLQTHLSRMPESDSQDFFTKLNRQIENIFSKIEKNFKKGLKGTTSSKEKNAEGNETGSKTGDETRIGNRIGNGNVGNVSKGEGGNGNERAASGGKRKSKSKLKKGRNFKNKIKITRKLKKKINYKL